MKSPLFISGYGAVTPGGVNARQTIAAVRAALTGFEETTLLEPFGATQIVARIPSHYELRFNDRIWLVNMAARALLEAMGSDGRPELTALLVAPPEKFRQHPGMEPRDPTSFLAQIIQATGMKFHAASRAVDGGPAACFALLGHASNLLDQGLDQVLVGGVDTLVNHSDLNRLRQANRLKGPDNAQGLVPGEGACFVRLTRSRARGDIHMAIHGFGMATEADTALSDRYSQGRAILAALQDATRGAGPREADVRFIISNGNGERYSGWEALISRPRFYRTNRSEMFPVVYPAMTVGDTGSAAGALGLILAADSFSKGYAPGPVAMCEVASEGGLRAAAIVSKVGR